MLIKTQAIVLKTLKFGESQLVIDLFTESIGCVSFIHPLLKTKRNRMGKQFFQPLTLLEIEFDSKQNDRLHRFKDIRIAYPFVSLPFDPYKQAIALFIAEFLYHCLRSEQQSPSLYRYVVTSINWLDASENSFSNFHLVFMMHFSRFIGFYPNLENYRRDDFFDLRDGIFCSSIPLHPDYVVPAEAAKINLLMRMNYESMHLFRFSRQERNRCIDLILHYYRLHIPAFPKLKSQAVLQELFR